MIVIVTATVDAIVTVDAVDVAVIPMDVDAVMTVIVMMIMIVTVVVVVKLNAQRASHTMQHGIDVNKSTIQGLTTIFRLQMLSRLGDLDKKIVSSSHC